MLTVLLFVLVLGSSSCADVKKEDKHKTQLGPCQACKILVKSFHKAMEATSRGKHEGGDADWESKKLKSYEHSEVRLTEIQSLLCTDVEIGKNQCHHLAGEVEDVVESEWWALDSPRPDLHLWLCIEKKSVCCPVDHFGASCQPCPGGSPPCSGRGRCKGAGTRKGNGQCACEEGYTGDTCSACNSSTHFASGEKMVADKMAVTCEKCHASCGGPCTGAGAKLCVRCAPGYFRHAEEGCVDEDECRQGPSSSGPCHSHQFCVNNVGSFSCLDCDKSCSRCHGDGPDMCIACAENHVKQDGVCVDEKQAGRKRHATAARYLTYIGLAVAALILTQKSALLASIIAACVAIYIAVAEYQLNTADAQINSG